MHIKSIKWAWTAVKIWFSYYSQYVRYTVDIIILQHQTALSGCESRVADTIKPTSVWLMLVLMLMSSPGIDPKKYCSHNLINKWTPISPVTWLCWVFKAANVKPISICKTGPGFIVSLILFQRSKHLNLG